MRTSVFDLFTIGIGPSSSHTVGPMRAARSFAASLEASGAAARTRAIRVELFGSLGLTGKGHGTDRAVLLGLEGARPERLDPDAIGPRLARIAGDGSIRLPDGTVVPFQPDADLVFHRRRRLPLHANGMRFTASGDDREVLLRRVSYSVGGGFVMDEQGARGRPDVEVPYPFSSGADLLRHEDEHGLSISDLVLANESVLRPGEPVRARLVEIWEAMQACVRRGCEREGTLPGGLNVARRAPALHRELLTAGGDPEDPLRVLDWVSLYALAVSEENAAGGRVVTAPTNGAAGIVPAVLHYFVRYRPEASEERVVRFLLAAAAVGILFEENASISGAEVGCQGEVGVACAMAAAGLAEARGGTVAQVENAAEIGMEHNLGLTCDPVGGLVQIPCIERNAMGAVKAINAARLALSGDGRHHISLDRVIRTMRRTGQDMATKYKETSRGGLAVSHVEC